MSSGAIRQSVHNVLKRDLRQQRSKRETRETGTTGVTVATGVAGGETDIESLLL